MISTLIFLAIFPHRLSHAGVHADFDLPHVAREKPRRDLGHIGSPKLLWLVPPQVQPGRVGRIV